MGLKLFYKSKPLSLYDMRLVDPNRTPTDFSDPIYQHQANLAAGYRVAGETNISVDGTLHIFSDGDKLFRAQNSVLYAKDKTK